jgi:hypothetical protein
MADLGRKTGSTSYELTIEEPTSGILIALASGANIFTTETVKVQLRSRGKDVTIIPEMTILKAIEMFETDEMVVKTIAGESQAVIPFTPSMDEIGCDIDATKGERIIVTLGSMISGSNYDIYTKEVESNVRVCYQIDQKSINTGTEQTHDVAGYDQAILPLTDLVSIEEFRATRTIERSKAQLIFEDTISGEVKQVRGISLSGNAETLDITSMFEPSSRVAVDLKGVNKLKTSAVLNYTYEAIKTQTY